MRHYSLKVCLLSLACLSVIGSGYSADVGQPEKFPAYWENPALPAAEFVTNDADAELFQGITVNGNMHAPLEDYKKYTEEPMIEFYNMATGRMMVFTSMQEFVNFADAADFALVEQMVEDEYNKRKGILQKGSKSAVSKVLMPNGWDTDESITVMNYPYVVGCSPVSSSGSIFGDGCTYGPPTIWGRDARFNSTWWRPARSGDDDDSFVLTATPLNPDQREDAEEDDHVYVSEVRVAHVCEVRNIFGCHETWSEQTAKSIVLGPFSDVTLIAEGQPPRVVMTPNMGAVQTRLEAPAGQIFIKNPMFWDYCSRIPNCRNRMFTVSIPVYDGSGMATTHYIVDYRPETRGMAYYRWEFFRMIPNLDRVIIAAGNRSPVVDRIRVSSYGRGSLVTRPGENILTRTSRLLAAMSEAVSGCDTSIVRHKLPTRPNEFWCPVPTKIESILPGSPGTARALVEVPLQSGGLASIFRYFTPGLTTSDTRMTSGVSTINLDCSAEGVRMFPLNQFACQPLFNNFQAEACRLVPLVFARTSGTDMRRSYVPDSRFSLAYTSSGQLVIPPTAVILGATNGMAPNEGFDRCATLYRAYIPGGPMIPGL